MKYKQYVTGKYTRARAPLGRKYANRIFESKDGTTSMKIVNYIEDITFVEKICLPSPTVLKYRHKVEERTFGTPCKQSLLSANGLKHPDTGGTCDERNG